MQDREPPAYLEYAAAMLASRTKRLMTATELGVAWAMKLECWVNRSVPAEPGALAVILGLDTAEVTAALPAVMPFFAYVGEEIVCPELENYRAYLLRIRTAQSEGGKRGSVVLHKKRGPSKTRANKGPEGDSVSNSQVTQLGTHDSSIQPNSSKPNPTPPLRKEVAPDPFVTEYTDAQRTECSEAAYRARRG